MPHSRKSRVEPSGVVGESAGRGRGVLIAIPVFNERRHVEDVLKRVLSFHPEVLLVDDGSSDGTGEYLGTRKDVRLLRHAVNQGYGQSLIDAFDYAGRHGFEWVITMDCDEQHEPEMIPAFLDRIAEDRWDLISGSRYLRARSDDDNAPQDRAAINGIVTRLLNKTYGLTLTDSFCGFKAHRVSATRELGLTERGYAFPLQLWPAVVKQNLRLTEIPVRRIYVDPKRSFGATLDQPLIRLTHYLEVLSAEHERNFGKQLALPDAASLFSSAAADKAASAIPEAAVAENGMEMGAEVGECCGCCCD